MKAPRPEPQPAARPRVKAVVDTDLHCWRCGRKIAESVARPWRITCARCRAQNASLGEG